MPYRWSTDDPSSVAQQLELWPHRSLSPAGFAAFILATFTFALIPLMAMLGTPLLWGLLPFVLLAIGGMYFALRRNDRDRRILEVLTLTCGDLRLVRHNPKGSVQEWHCNTYWARIALHQGGGPVPNYVTLSGSGREVEIGAFLSEEERKALYSDLKSRISSLSQSPS